MAGFKNLGDLIQDDVDLTKIAIIDLGGEEVPTEYTYAELDAMTMSVARALAKGVDQRYQTARAFAVCAAIRSGSVRSPRCTRKQSSGPGTAPARQGQ